MALTACGRAASTPKPIPTTAFAVKQPRVPPGILRAAAVLHDAYRHGDWGQVRRTFSVAAPASSLVSRMQLWKGQNITEVHVAVDHADKVGPNRYVATLRFYVDPRAIPDFEVYLFSTAGKVAKILKHSGNLAGTSFQQADWSVTRTQHFVVFHSPYQLVGADRSYLVDLEHQRALFAKRFRIRLPSLAHYYLYPTREEMSRLTHGACGSHAGEVGCTSPFSDPPTIQTTIQATYHEPIHVYELALLPKPVGRTVYVAPLFIGEGTAVALEDRELDPRLSDYCSDLIYAPLDDCARTAIRETDPMAVLSDQGFNRADAGDAYALGGSFVKYLILHYGYPRFGRFYHQLAAQPQDRLVDYDVASRGVYSKPTRALVSEWKRSLCASGC